MVNKKWHLAVFFVRVNSTPVYGIVLCCPVFERTAEKSVYIFHCPSPCAAVCFNNCLVLFKYRPV